MTIRPALKRMRLFLERLRGHSFILLDLLVIDVSFGEYPLLLHGPHIIGVFSSAVYDKSGRTSHDLTYRDCFETEPKVDTAAAAPFCCRTRAAHRKKGTDHESA
jgi:hypothetical protein